ncbi:MAG: DsbA family protein [Pseudomonadota bacterium]
MTRLKALARVPTFVRTGAVCALLGVGGLLAYGAATTPAALAQTQAGPVDEAQRKQIEGIIRNYLLKNPRLMLEVQQALQKELEKEEAARAKLAVKQNANEIFRKASSPVAGDKQGDVTIVEFFDYNCGYCKRAFTDLAAYMKTDSKVRVVFKELPILSRGSEEAARVALAAGLQGKYWEVHRDLLNLRGRAGMASALRIAQRHGLDMAKLRKDLTNPVVEKEIADTRALAQRMGINGTPHFLVGDRAIAGAPQNLRDVFANHVKDLRKNGCDVC